MPPTGHFADLLRFPTTGTHSFTQEYVWSSGNTGLRLWSLDPSPDTLPSSSFSHWITFDSGVQHVIESEWFSLSFRLTDLASGFSHDFTIPGLAGVNYSRGVPDSPWYLSGQ